MDRNVKELFRKKRSISLRRRSARSRWSKSNSRSSTSSLAKSSNFDMSSSRLSSFLLNSNSRGSVNNSPDWVARSPSRTNSIDDDANSSSITLQHIQATSRTSSTSYSTQMTSVGSPAPRRSVSDASVRQGDPVYPNRPAMEVDFDSDTDSDASEATPSTPLQSTPSTIEQIFDQIEDEFASSNAPDSSEPGYFGRDTAVSSA